MADRMQAIEVFKAYFVQSAKYQLFLFGLARNCHVFIITFLNTTHKIKKLRTDETKSLITNSL